MTTPSKILIVDDEESMREYLGFVVSNLGYEFMGVPDGNSALAVAQEASPDAILLDCRLPGLDGFQILSHLQSNPKTNHIPVLMLSGDTSEEVVLKCIENGADDFLPKPIATDLVKARLNGCLARKQRFDDQAGLQRHFQSQNEVLRERLLEHTREVSRAQLATIFALSKLAESRDPETGQHLERMREYCKVLLMGLRQQEGNPAGITHEFIDLVYEASPLHDIGKVGIPDHILLKPGKLTPEEYEVIKTHTSIGAETLRQVDAQYPGNDFVKVGIEIAQSHHERWDGAGYPQGLSGTDIPLAARVLAVGDVYDALTSKRCYKEAFTHEDSRAIILQGTGAAFDPEVVRAFVEMEAEFIRIRKSWTED